MCRLRALHRFDVLQKLARSRAVQLLRRLRSMRRFESLFRFARLGGVHALCACGALLPIGLPRALHRLRRLPLLLRLRWNRGPRVSHLESSVSAERVLQAHRATQTIARVSGKNAPLIGATTKASRGARWSLSGDSSRSRAPTSSRAGCMPRGTRCPPRFRPFACAASRTRAREKTPRGVRDRAPSSRGRLQK